MIWSELEWFGVPWCGDRVCGNSGGGSSGKCHSSASGQTKGQPGFRQSCKWYYIRSFNTLLICFFVLVCFGCFGLLESVCRLGHCETYAEGGACVFCQLFGLCVCFLFACLFCLIVLLQWLIVCVVSLYLYLFHFVVQVWSYTFICALFIYFYVHTYIHNIINITPHHLSTQMFWN